MKLVKPHLRQVAKLRNSQYLPLPWSKFMQNPLWYVTVISCLAGLTTTLHFWWWLTGLIALIWGLGLVWHSFSQDKTGVTGEEQLQTWLDQAHYYRAQIQQALKSTPGKSLSLDGPALAAQVNGWTEAIQVLVQRLAHLRRDDLIRQEIIAVPKAIALLETQLAGAGNAALHSHLEQVLANRRNQLVLLAELQSRMKQTEIQIENTLALLSTIYSQILTGQSIRHTADYEHLLADLEEEAHRLQDQLEALHEVKEVNLAQKTPFRAWTHRCVESPPTPPLLVD